MNGDSEGNPHTKGMEKTQGEATGKGTGKEHGNTQEGSQRNLTDVGFKRQRVEWIGEQLANGDGGPSFTF